MNSRSYKVLHKLSRIFVKLTNTMKLFKMNGKFGVIVLIISFFLYQFFKKKATNSTDESGKFRFFNNGSKFLCFELKIYLNVFKLISIV